MNETFRRLHGEAQAALLEAMDGASVKVERPPLRPDWVFRMTDLHDHCISANLLLLDNQANACYNGSRRTHR